jgi:hypothetical protein
MHNNMQWPTAKLSNKTKDSRQQQQQQQQQQHPLTTEPHLSSSPYGYLMISTTIRRRIAAYLCAFVALK